jgi:hypothetical protein
VTNDPAISSVAPQDLPPGLPAGWQLDRDLPCPACGYNLRMLHTPRCPECGQAFRWQALLHLFCPRCAEDLRQHDGNACPRCALPLDWGRLLLAAPVVLTNSCEYARRPVRAALRTAFAVLRPSHFWRGVWMEGQINLPRLRRMRRVLLLIGLAAFALLAVPDPALIAHSSAFGWSGWSGWSGHDPWHTAMLEIPLLLLVVSVVPLVTFLTLPRFSPTLARFSIRREHFVRVSAFAMLVLLFLAVLLAGFAVTSALLNLSSAPVSAMSPLRQVRCWFDPLPATLDLCSAWRSGWLPWRPGWGQSPWTLLVPNGALLGGVALLILWWSRFLYAALRDYLRLNRRNALALWLSTQSIGLAALAVALALWAIVAADLGLGYEILSLLE